MVKAPASGKKTAPAPNTGGNVIRAFADGGKMPAFIAKAKAEGAKEKGKPVSKKHEAGESKRFEAAEDKGFANGGKMKRKR